MRTLLQIFSSLKLTIGILLGFGALIGYATFYEVDGATGAIRRDFYRTPGFLGILAMLGVNLAACTLKRAPFQAHQIGYVTTHGGLMMILVGSMLTFAGGVEGTLPLAEQGASPAEATRDTFDRTDVSPELEIAYVDGERVVPLGRFPVSPAPDLAVGGVGRLGWILFILAVVSGVLFLLRIWERGEWYRPVPYAFLGVALLACAARAVRPPREDLPRFPVTQTLEVAVTRNVPRAALSRRVRDGGPAENPAALVEIRSQEQRLEERQWLFARDPSRSHMQVGPLLVLFAPDVDLAGVRERIQRQMEGVLVMSDGAADAAPRHVWVRAARREWTDAGGGFTLRVDRFFPDLAVDPKEDDPDERFSSASDTPRNPAVLFALRRPDGAEGLFLARPGVPLEAVEGDLSPPAAVSFHMDPQMYVQMRRAMVILTRTDAGYRYLCTSRSGQTEEGSLQVGQPIRYPFMPLPLFFAVAEEAARAWEEAVLVPSDDPNAGPGLACRVTLGGKSRETGVLLDVAEPSRVVFDAETAYDVRYKRREDPLGFTVTLRDFRKVDYPGTDRASSYESDVTVADGAAAWDQTVRVNEPLSHEGFVLYQSSYAVDGRGREMSIFAVARDPGARLVYAGFAVFGVGLLLIFYLKPILIERRRRRSPAGA